MKLRLREILEDKGVSSKALAKEVGLSEQSISYALNGKTIPSINSLEKIAIALQIPFWHLFENPESILSQESNPSSFTCPHCGKPLEIKIS